MTAIPSHHPAGVRTSITCTKCGKAATVPFAPTPGRPVFCRDCFSRPAQGGAPGGAPSSGGYVPRGPDSPGARAARAALPGKKRMMAQGRKTHFIYDARGALVDLPGGMDDKDARAFLEGLFARGSRGSVEAAQEFLDEKLVAELITPDQRNALGRLVERYSFYR